MLIRALRATTALALFVAPAAAQSTRSSLSTYANATFIANGVGLITGPEVNVGFTSLVTAAGFLNDSNDWLGGNHFLSTVTFDLFPTFPGFVATGGSTAATFADRATDGGVTFNLKTDFGAACDGSTDDTTAIQAWLAKAAPGVKLVAPGGTCLFSSPLTVGAASRYAIAGAGPQTTIFRYTGASTTATLLTINSPNAAAVYGISLAGFRMQSTTVMTGGFAIQANGLFASVLDNVAVDQVAYGDAYDGNFCGGVWFNGVGGVDYTNPSLYSTRKCGDGIRVNSNLGGTAELRIVGGQVQGWAVGGHMAGGFGGFRFDGSNIAANKGGVLIDTSQVASPNREFDLGALAAVDGSDDYGIRVNDSLSGGGTIDIAGWVASTKSGHGIEILDWTNGDVEFRGHKIYNNCGSGVYVADAGARLAFSSGTYINNNGAALGAACTTWKAANPGHGYGVEAASALNTAYSVTGIPKFADNAGGAFNANSGMVQEYTRALANLSAISLVAAPGNAIGLTLAAGGAGHGAQFYFSNGATTYWSIGIDTGGQLAIWDQANSGAWLLRCLTGGACTFGEAGATVTMAGDFAVTGATTLTGAATLSGNASIGGNATVAGTLGVTGATTLASLDVTPAAGSPAVIRANAPSGQAAALSLKINGALQAALKSDTTTAYLYDGPSGGMFWSCMTGGACTIGEQASNVLTVIGSLAAKASAAPTASGSCAVNTQTGGQIAGSFKANGACAGGTVTLTFAATQANGFSCDARDETNPADLMNQTAHTGGSVTFTGTMAANDVVVWKCIGF